MAGEFNRIGLEEGSWGLSNISEGERMVHDWEEARREVRKSRICQLHEQEKRQNKCSHGEKEEYINRFDLNSKMRSFIGGQYTINGNFVGYCPLCHKEFTKKPKELSSKAVGRQLPVKEN